jgi:glycosyltransferase involved in cell wall biosynthesis
VSYLKFATEDLLNAGYALTLAIDPRPASMGRIMAQMEPLLGRVRVVSARDPSGRWRSGSAVAAVAACLKESGADFVFLNNFDEIASEVLRRAAFGSLPPPELRGRLGGIYLRPRFLGGCGWSPNLWLKAAGFSRLVRGGWLNQLLLLDPYLVDAARQRWPAAPLAHLPDPYPEPMEWDRAEARTRFGLPPERRVFLFYGGAYRRKGLPLTVEAMLGLRPDSKAMLLCAGERPAGDPAADGLRALEQQGRAVVINRYVTADEERQLFAACDVVLLPYIGHFGSSGLQVRAAGAGRPVLASDEELVGRLVREHGLGVLFQSGDAGSLRAALDATARASEDEMERWRRAARAYAPRCSRAAWRRALLDSFARAAGS